MYFGGLSDSILCQKCKSSLVHIMACRLNHCLSVTPSRIYIIEILFQFQTFSLKLALENVVCKMSAILSRPGYIKGDNKMFLAVTKQLYKWYFPSVCPSVRLSVCLSVCLSHLFHHVPIIVSSWNFQELLPWSKMISMQKVTVRGQRSRSQRSTPNLAVSGL